MTKILLIEDDSLMIRMYQRKFKADGYELETALNGVEGFNKAKTFSPNLILLDIMMPKMNGLEVLKKLKHDAKTSHIPVVILTNLGASEDDIDRGLELGAVAYLVKSANRPDQVVSKVKEILAGYTHDQDVPAAATVTIPILSQKKKKRS